MPQNPEPIDLHSQDLRDWPHGGYCGNCQDCGWRFMGPKREKLCYRCYERVLAEVVGELGLNHAGGADLCACLECGQKFLGSKGYVFCRACTQTVWEGEANTAIRIVVRFYRLDACSDIDRMGLDADLLPKGMRILQCQFYPGSRRLASIGVSSMTEDELHALSRKLRSTDISYEISIDQTDIQVWRMGRKTCLAGHETVTFPIMPMSTAPRDGTPILARFRSDATIDKSHERLRGTVSVVSCMGHGGWVQTGMINIAVLPDLLEGWRPISEGMPGLNLEGRK